MEATAGESHHDVVIVGGGFAGASTALLLERLSPGRRVLILERDTAAGRKVGEATVEISGTFLTRVLGQYDLLAREHLPKHGLRYWFSDGPGRSLAEMSEVGPRNISSLPSFLLDRSRLDERLLSRAREAGAEVRRPARVTGIDLEWPRGRVRFEDGSGEHQVTARWVIDASGRRAILARKLGTYRPTQSHPTAAVWARWRGVADMDGPAVMGTDPRRPALPQLIAARRLATNHFCGYGWWCWVIPLQGGETSIGLVYDKTLFRWPSEGKLREQYVDFVRTRVSGLSELLREAEIDGDDWLAYPSLPYRSTRYMGRGWGLVGDAGGFMDPYYSPGLDHASISIFATARTIAEELGGGLSPAALDERIESHNGAFLRSYDRWLDALYVGKYELLGDAELTGASFLFDTAMYFLGIVGPVWRDLEALANPPFGLESRNSRLAHRTMSLFKRRMIRLARFRRRTGAYGRRNVGWRVYVPSFELGSGSLRHLLLAVRIWLAAEVHYLLHRLRHGDVNVSAPVPSTDPLNPS